eukprot:354859-Chlamydomonas_euryale.AAC.3
MSAAGPRRLSPSGCLVKAAGRSDPLPLRGGTIPRNPPHLPGTNDTSLEPTAPPVSCPTHSRATSCSPVRCCGRRPGLARAARTPPTVTRVPVMAASAAALRRIWPAGAVHMYAVRMYISTCCEGSGLRGGMHICGTHVRAAKDLACGCGTHACGTHVRMYMLKRIWPAGVSCMAARGAWRRDALSGTGRLAASMVVKRV